MSGDGHMTNTRNVNELIFEDFELGKHFSLCKVSPKEECKILFMYGSEVQSAGLRVKN